MKLAIHSWGAVTPAGAGAGCLGSDWPLVTEASASGRPVAVGRVDRTACGLDRWETLPRMRRASPITYFLIEAVSQTLEAAGDIDRSRIGIVTTFFLGCLDYSVKFYRQITREGRRFGSPVLFPETVFNSPLSHVVATLGLGGPVYSLIGDKAAWLAGLRTAQCWLANGDCDHVIIAGAEEFEPHELDALHAGGLLRHPLAPCEGAAAVLLGRGPDGADAAISGFADGFTFRDKRGAETAAAECFSRFPEDIPALPAATGWMVPIEGKLLRSRPKLQRSPFSADGFTLSSAADTFRAARAVASGEAREVLVPVWGPTREVGALVVAGT